MDLNGLPLTHRHLKALEFALKNLVGKSWSLSNPVFILDRCWLRLEEIMLSDLIKRLPLDNSAEAPEIIKYHQLINDGCEPLLATQICWLEFGIEDFHIAIRRYWSWQEKGNNGWDVKMSA